MPAKLRDRLEPIIEHGKGLADGHEKGVTPLPKVPLIRFDPLAPVKEAIQPVKDTAEKIEQEAEKVGERVKNTADDLTKKFALMLEEGAKRQAEADKAEKERLLARAAKLGVKCGADWPLSIIRRAVAQVEEEGAEKDRLLVLAGSLKLACDESWSLPRLRAEVDRRLDEEWSRHGPNGRCLRCKRPMRVSTKGNLLYLCSCGASVYSKAVRSMGAPPRPKNFRGFNQ